MRRKDAARVLSHSLLLARVEHEDAIAIEPQTLVSWSYRERMGDAA